MENLKRRTYVGIGMLAIFGMSLLSSCTASKNQSAWMDLPHARELDHHKGNKSKKIQKHQVYANRRGS